MMDRLREGVNSIAVKIILSLIILTFVFAGVGNYLVSGSNNGAAEVEGTKIGRQQFEQAYQNERNRMQSQMGDYFSNLLADPNYVASLRMSVLNRMIDDVLIEKKARDLGLRVSDTQVRNTILSMEPFQKDGKFDQDVYQSALRRAGYNADTFAEYLRGEMLRGQVIDALSTSEFTLAGETQVFADLYGQTREIKKIVLSSDDFKSEVKVSDEEIDQYYQTHSQQFTRPEQFKIAYVELAAKQIKDSIDVSDEEAQTYYQDNIASYSSQAQRDLSHILFKAEDKATAQEVLAKLQSGEDFAALAKEYSQDPGSATQGGELGWVEKGVMDPDFETAAFSLAQPGDVSDVVESSFGLHIIKLNAEKAAQAKPFSDVKADVIAKIQDQKAVDKFYELQSELEKVAFESPDSLDASAKAISGEIQSTDFISLGELPALLDNTQVRNALENAEVKEDRLNSSVLNLGPEDVVVVRINDSRPETLLPLADVRDDVVAALTEQKAQAAAQALAEQIVESLKKGDETILAAHQLSFSESETVQRNAPSAASIFAMPKPVDGKPVYAQIEGLTGETEVVQLIKVDTQANDNLNTQIAMQLQRVNQQKDTQGVLSILRKNADIKYYISGTN